MKNILVAPLNWGLGHATRCIPIINELELHGYTPIIASDGMALALLKMEFPNLIALELPSYGIRYPKNGKRFRLQMVQNLPRIISAIRKENSLIKNWNQRYQFAGIISDNRAGIYLENVPSVYITHQIRVLSGFSTFLSSFLHRKTISKFDQCWIPDFEDAPNLSFGLSHLKHYPIPTKFIGTLSRFAKENFEKKYDLIIILSGPEPQRGILEQLLRKQLSRYKGKVLFVEGKVSEKQQVLTVQNVTFYNFMTSQQLEASINQSEIMLCRSGYTSAMDLAKLNKKCFFIPTPGQFEQEYLAKKYNENQYAPFSKQTDFRIEDLIKVRSYNGFPNRDNVANWQELFSLFKTK